MSRDLDDANYYVSQGGKIPVKWTAPEVCHIGRISTTYILYNIVGPPLQEVLRGQ